MSEPLIQCVSLTCGYRGKSVLTNIDFEIRAGEVLALLGPNGSGKSTLLKTISGEIPAIQGQVLLQGKDVAVLTEKEIARSVAVAPQEEAHRFGFTVREIAAMGRHAQSESFFDSEEDNKATNEALETADCADLAERRITEISGGEKQRVLLARTLVQDTPALLLDEPTSHLDVAHQVGFARLIRSVAASGKAVLAAIHDLNLASILADRGLLLSGGRLVADKPMHGLLEDDAFDRAYSVQFQRITGEDGNVRLYVGL